MLTTSKSGVLSRLGMLLGRLEILSFCRPFDSGILAQVSKHLRMIRGIRVNT